MDTTPGHYELVVVGSGFGGSMTALSLARKYKERGRGEKILILERGTWWTTPVGTVQDKEVRAYDFLKGKQQPVQFWSSVEHFKGFFDIVLRCLRSAKNADGLYDVTTFGRMGFLGIGSQYDGVSILRASGVGGGSLVYANVTIRPPDFIFQDPRWPLSWDKAAQDQYYETARNAIGRGVIFALNEREAHTAVHDSPHLLVTGRLVRHEPQQYVTLEEAGNRMTEYPLAPDARVPTPAPLGRMVWLFTERSSAGTLVVKEVVDQGPFQINTGLSNIATRSARLDPHWDPAALQRGIKRIDPTKSTPADHTNDLWIDRARVFQTTMSALTGDYGTVDSSINDITPEPNPFDPHGAPKNYCERQGRCIVGCLPGARHTLNKQLMAAALGTPQGAQPQFPDLAVQALAEVDYIEARQEGGYTIHYFQRDAEKPWVKTRRAVTADRVIVAAGCVGTNEIMLRSKDKGGLPHLSDRLGFGFSTNGDYLAFLEGTAMRVSLTRGPITTSYAHFQTPEAAPGADPTKFHTLEDNGIPRAFSALTGFGVPLLRSLAKGRRPSLLILLLLFFWLLKRGVHYIRAFFVNDEVRQDIFMSEDEYTDHTMCVAVMGREAAVGQFRLGKGAGDTPLRVNRADGKGFHEDPIYQDIQQTLDRFAERLAPGTGRTFINPFLTPTAGALGAKAIGLSHPLGGCRMAQDATAGVVDEYGRVFDTTKSGDRPFYEGLYLADAAIIPTALGVNPSLTIAALALRIADKISDELDSRP
jgi:choline dehydrogenase-like flavoprotein